MRHAVRLDRPGARPSTPGSMLVIPPRSVMDDELRLARLGEYLEAEFPDLDLMVSEDRRLAGSNPAVGLMPRRDGRAVLSDGDTKALIGRVLDAVETFIGYGVRRH